MKHNRGLKLKLAITILCIAVSGILVYFQVTAREKKVLSSLPIQETLIDDNEVFAAEKIPLNGDSSSLDGPWGNLELEPCIVQPSADYIVNQVKDDEIARIASVFLSGRQWVFRDSKLEDISSLFLSAGLDKEAYDVLMANTKANEGINGYITTPPDEVLLGFTPEIRAKLYPLIGKYSDNTMYGQPVYYNSVNAEEWFSNSALSEDMVKKILPLVYVRDGMSFISDLHLVMPLFDDRNDFVNLLQTLYRNRSYNVYLKIDEGQDISQLVDYWGNLYRADYVKPQLESLENSPGGGKIDITKLLPPIPKKRLNTYIGDAEFVSSPKDCFWTAINFFNNESDERYEKIPDQNTFIAKISRPLGEGKPQFGDLIFITDDSGKATHACVYIADNLVLTKNGEGCLSSPFVLADLDKTAALYGEKVVFCTRTIGNTSTVALKTEE